MVQFVLDGAEGKRKLVDLGIRLQVLVDLLIGLVE